MVKNNEKYLNINNQKYFFWRILKAPPANPGVYIYWYYNITVDLIFYAPNVANLGFWGTVLTIALGTEKVLVRGISGGAFSIRPFSL